MKFSPPKIWKPNDDIWDLCELVERVPSFRAIFTGDLLDIKSGELVQRAIGPNVILDVAIDKLLSGNNLKFSWNWLAVGTNATEPQRSDLGIITPANPGAIADGSGSSPARTTGPVDVVGDPNSWTYTGYWPSDKGNGNLAEVGLTGFQMGYLNRALFRDLDGITPVVIPKTTAFILRVTAQMKLQFQRLS